MNRRLYNAYNRLEIKKANKENLIPGLLGFMLGGEKTVLVPNRLGYVYVRIRSNTNELVMAYNDQVSPVYDLPVLLVRDEVDKTRYKIQGRDVGKYENWGSVSSYLPLHGNQHSFSPDTGGGGDIVWVYDRQLAPLLVSPSGTKGSAGVLIGQDIFYVSGEWKSAGGTGTVSLLPAKPTNNQARIVLIYLDTDLNPGIVTGTLFNATITGTYAISPYIPAAVANSYPLAAVRLVSGTSTILWDNIYDVRPIFAENIAGVETYVTVSPEAGLTNSRKITAGAGISITDGGAGGNIIIAITGSLGGGGSSTLIISDDNVFKVSGSAIDFGANLAVVVTGTTAYVSVTSAGLNADTLDGNDATAFASGSHTHPSVGTSLVFYENGVFKATGTAVSFGNNLNVFATGSVVFVDAESTGGGGSGLAFFNNSVFLVSGTAIDLDESFQSSISGTNIVHLSANRKWHKTIVNDDFISGAETDGTVGALGWNIGEGTFATRAGELNHPGIISLTTSATPGRGTLILSPGADTPRVVADALDAGYFGSIIRPASSTFLTSGTYRSGIASNYNFDGEAGNYGAYWMYNYESGSSYWYSHTQDTDSNVIDIPSSVVVASGSWVLLEIVQKSIGSWDFYINDAFHATHNAYISGTFFASISVTNKLPASGAKSLHVDWAGFETKEFTQRWS